MGDKEQYYYNWETIETENVGGDYSTSRGPVIKGEQIQMSLVTKPRGTGANLHTHPNEQFNYVLKGTLRCTVGGQEKMVGAGEVIYIPPGVEHATIATQDEDVIFLAVKDTRYGMVGKAVDAKAGKHYDENFKPDDEK